MSAQCPAEGNLPNSSVHSRCDFCAGTAEYLRTKVFVLQLMLVTVTCAVLLDKLWSRGTRATAIQHDIVPSRGDELIANEGVAHPRQTYDKRTKGECFSAVVNVTELDVRKQSSATGSATVRISKSVRALVDFASCSAIVRGRNERLSLLRVPRMVLLVIQGPLRWERDFIMDIHRHIDSWWLCDISGATISLLLPFLRQAHEHAL